MHYFLSSRSVSQPQHRGHFGEDNSLLWACNVHCSMFSRIPGFYPLDINVMSLTVVATKMPPDIANFHVGKDHPGITTGLDETSSSHHFLSFCCRVPHVHSALMFSECICICFLLWIWTHCLDVETEAHRNQATCPMPCSCRGAECGLELGPLGSWCSPSHPNNQTACSLTGLYHSSFHLPHSKRSGVGVGRRKECQGEWTDTVCHELSTICWLHKNPAR